MPDSTFEKLTGANPAPEKIATGFRFTEGPVFSRLGYLLFSDPPSGRIMKWEAGKVTVFREKSNGAGGLTFDHQGRLLACEQGRVTRTEKNGAVTVLADRCETVPLNHPNDVVYAIDGTIYFTDGNQDASVLCRIDRKGNVHTASRECRMAHGVALAPNQQKLYVADAGDANIRVYDISGDGSLKNGRLFAEARSQWTQDGRGRQCLGYRRRCDHRLRFAGNEARFDCYAGNSQQLRMGRGIPGSICDGEVLCL